MIPLSIGKVALLAQVGVETIRFYERQGLIDEPPRKNSGYRQFPEETVARLRFIKRGKELGFTLKEIKELLALRMEPGVTCENVRSRAEVKISDIEERMLTLERMKEALLKLVKACRERGQVNECPILEAMEVNEP